MYKVLHDFYERFDDRFLYKAGDVYPREGFEPTEERLKELTGKSNKYKQAFIKKEKAAPAKPVEEKVEEK